MAQITFKDTVRTAQ